jgi:hypothetical protein
MKGTAAMKKPNEVCPGDFDEVFLFLEDVYGGAYWALQHGATKEDLIDQIEQAIAASEADVKQRRPGLDTGTRDGEASA